MSEEEKTLIFAKHYIKDNEGVFEFPKKELEILVNLIEKQNNRLEQLEKENKELKEDLKYVLDQTLGAFENNWCIDWNFTDIREKYNLGEE